MATKTNQKQPKKDYNDSNLVVYDLMISGYIRKISQDKKQNFPLDVIKVIATFASLCDCWDAMNSHSCFKILESKSYLELSDCKSKRYVAFGLISVEKGQKVVWNIKLLKGASGISIGIIPTKSILSLSANTSCFKSNEFGAIGLDVGTGWLYNNSDQGKFFESAWENDIITMELDMSRDYKKYSESGKTSKKCTLRYCINSSYHQIVCKVDKKCKYKLAVSMQGRGDSSKLAIKIIDDTTVINQTSVALW